ncbi:MAG: DUF2225 domain-containing protein [candidate division Zixibacteria bacterium]|nr:DUF2225 domain-containing protein [candidate division Zixibacteria bacterium]
MNKNQEPLFYSQLECPVCKTMNEYENVKTGSYTEDGRDTDFRPTGRIWLNPAYEKYDPLLFFMATCRKCFYTREFNHDYKKWQQDVSFKTYRLKNLQSKYLNELSKEDGIIRFLGNHINQEKYPFESAVIKFLLGIYSVKLSGRPPQLDLGRYFLRIGWLFRSQAGDEPSEGKGSANLFSQLRSAVQSAKLKLPEFEQEIGNIRKMLDHDFPILFENAPEADQYRQNIQQAISGISSEYDSLINATSELENVLGEAEKTLLGADLPTDEPGFFEFGSFTEFLRKAGEGWAEVPFSENDAMRKAAEYYQKAYEAGAEISKGIQQIQAAYMIAELSRRIGEVDNANQYFNQTIRMGREIVIGKKGDKSTINFTQKLLDTAMQQARLNKKESEGVTS